MRMIIAPAKADYNKAMKRYNIPIINQIHHGIGVFAEDDVEAAEELHDCPFINSALTDQDNSLTVPATLVMTDTSDEVKDPADISSEV
jgi:hypothetical protein